MTGSLDRRALGVLGGGHLCVDLCQGAVPALLPFLAAERGYSYAALGALVLFSTIGSSIVQPLFGLLSDRIAVGGNAGWGARAVLIGTQLLLLPLLVVLPLVGAAAATIVLGLVGFVAIASFSITAAR